MDYEKTTDQKTFSNGSLTGVFKMSAHVTGVRITQIVTSYEACLRGSDTKTKSIQMIKIGEPTSR